MTNKSSQSPINITYKLNLKPIEIRIHYKHFKTLQNNKKTKILTFFTFSANIICETGSRFFNRTFWR